MSTLDLAAVYADPERPIEPPLKSAPDVARLMAQTFDAPSVATYAEHDPQSPATFWLYADGCMYRIDVKQIARRPAR